MGTKHIAVPELPLAVIKDEIDDALLAVDTRKNIKAIVPVTKGTYEEEKLKKRPQVFGSNEILKAKRLTSQEKLEVLNHDPLEQLVRLHDRLERTLENMEDIRDGRAKGKFSMEYYTQTLMLLQKNNNDLLRYGYARVSETINVEQKNAPILSIQLTTAETFRKDNESAEQGDTFDSATVAIGAT